MIALLSRSTGFPPKRAVGATFLLRVSLPTKFGRKYDPTSRTASNPTLLKHGARWPFMKPGNTKPTPEPEASKIRKPQTPRKAKESQPTPATRATTPTNRQEYERLRRQDPKRQEARRQGEKKRREKLRAAGLCRDCGGAAITGQTRCEECVEKRKQARLKAKAAQAQNTSI